MGLPVSVNTSRYGAWETWSKQCFSASFRPACLDVNSVGSVCLDPICYVAGSALVGTLIVCPEMSWISSHWHCWFWHRARFIKFKASSVRLVPIIFWLTGMVHQSVDCYVQNIKTQVRAVLEFQNFLQYTKNFWNTWLLVKMKWTAKKF
jgi:hypothetical protein